MKKIGIVTIHNVNNYGAELQAFALHSKLKRLGFENEIINYFFFKTPGFKASKRSKPIFPVPLINRLKDKANRGIDYYCQLRYPKISRRRRARFNQFHLENTKFSKEFKSIDELYSSQLSYTKYIVGSDQVWNPNNQTNLEPYFLTFAPENALKISYASSFGVSSIPESFSDRYEELLSNLDMISCRESHGVEIIKKIAGKKAKHVVDPTLLLSKDEWMEISKPYDLGEDYVLLYIFKKSEYVTRLVQKIKKETNLRVVRVCKNELPLEKDSEILNLRDLGPAEFLSLINNAKIVLTTSFHGTVFSLLFNKQFYAITPSSKDNNSRQISVLKKMGLMNRLLVEGDDLPDILSSAIDFDRVNNVLENEVNRSVEFLNQALK